jgi:hypothetical protein
MAAGPQGQQGLQGAYGSRGVDGATGWGYGVTVGPTGGYAFPSFIDNQTANITATAATAGSIYRITGLPEGGGGSISATLPASAAGNFWTFTNGTNASFSLSLGGSATFSGAVGGVFTTTNTSITLPALGTCTFVYTGSASNYYLF